MRKPTVITIVVNWKLEEATIGCIHSLEDLEFGSHIIVVDNGSRDGSAEAIRRRCPQVEMLELAENIGFGPACNRAIAHAFENRPFDYIFLFNNDAVIDSRGLNELIEAGEENPEAGVLGAKIYYQDAPTTIWYAGARRRQGVLAAADSGRGQKDEGQFNRLREVDYIFGAAMLIRRHVFEEVGLFDERFFLYLEDLDFCLRAQQQGFSLLFVPEARVWHQGSASTAESAALRRYYMAKSTVHFLGKHTTLSRSIPVFTFWVLVYLREIILDLVRGDLAIVKSGLSGLLSGVNEARKA